MLWWNRFKRVQILLNRSKSIKKYQKYYCCAWKCLNLSQQNQSEKSMDFVIFNGFWLKFECFRSFNQHFGQHFQSFKQKLIKINLKLIEIDQKDQKLVEINWKLTCIVHKFEFDFAIRIRIRPMWHSNMDGLESKLSTILFQSPNRLILLISLQFGSHWFSISKVDILSAMESSRSLRLQVKKVIAYNFWLL